jgi:vanillate O-demethylase monooxygenase subunit
MSGKIMAVSAYVRNLWYMAGWAEEVPDGGFLSRKLLDRPWIILRLEDGGYSMLADRCPHRFAPLSRGRREGDRMFCGYHGLGFDPSGQCVFNPFSDKLPTSAKVATMPVVEKHSALWFWPGDPDSADPALIPDFSFLDGPVPRRRGYLRMDANYELVIDNLMDLSHVEIVHARSFGLNGAIFAGNHSIRAEESGAIWNNWDMDGCSPPDWAKPMLPEGAKVDHWLHTRWNAPSCTALFIGLTKGGTERRDPVIPEMASPNIVTPETQSSSHYFFTSDDTDESAELTRKAFVEEDEPMLEAVQANLGDQDFWDARPISLPTDAGAIRARRELMKLRKAEAA